MLTVLLDGSMQTAGEIARAAGVGASTASAHLATLLAAGLVAVRTQGRHRYFRLADGDVAHAIEALALIGESPDHARSQGSRADLRPLRHARTCYGHLAGELGVRLHDALLAHGVVRFAGDRYALDGAGRDWLRRRDFDADQVRSSARGAVHPCVDWSERRDHFAGPLAVALLEHFVERRWLTRVTGSRALTVNAVTARSLDRFIALPDAPPRQASSLPRTAR